MSFPCNETCEASLGGSVTRSDYFDSTQDYLTYSLYKHIDWCSFKKLHMQPVAPWGAVCPRDVFMLLVTLTARWDLMWPPEQQD